MDDYAKSYGWSEWPFRIIVDKEFAKIWADRASLKSELTKRLRRIKALPHGTVQLLWADFGAGKSHTLRHMELECENDPQKALLPAYTEIPVKIDGLLGLFQRLVAAIADSVWDQIASTERRWIGLPGRASGSKDLRQALRLLGSTDGKAKLVAADWIRAERGVPHLALLRSYGISGRIETEDRIVEVVAELTRLVLISYPSGLIWFIDEFQRVADLPLRTRDAFLKAVVSLFNACPIGFHLVLSFSVAQQMTATALLPPDLQSRAATFPMLTLPLFSRTDARTFLVDLFRHFRSGDKVDGTYPFSPDALDAVIDHAETSFQGVTPRKLMELTQSVLFDIEEESGGNPPLPLPLEVVSDALARVSENRG